MTRRDACRIGGRRDDLKQFHDRDGGVSDQFDSYFIEPGIHHNGQLVLGESIGDLAGAKIAWLAFQKSLKTRPGLPPIDGLTPAQQFFIAWGQFPRRRHPPSETQRLMVQGDPHPIGKYRVIGPLSNSPEFAQPSAAKPIRRWCVPRKHCEVW